VDTLRDVLLELRRRVGNDPLAHEIDGFLANPAGAGGLFLPTGPLQELAMSGGWGDEFLALADRFEATAAGDAIHLCALCDNEAGRLKIVNGTLTRTAFTSTLTQPAGDAVANAIADAGALHALDPELVPFYCPACGHAYCGEHWTRRDVFDDDGWHDSIRGTCPHGHERLLED
jgi:hypothetical protein